VIGESDSVNIEGMMHRRGHFFQISYPSTHHKMSSTLTSFACSTIYSCAIPSLSVWKLQRHGQKQERNPHSLMCYHEQLGEAATPYVIKAQQLWCFKNMGPLCELTTMTELCELHENFYELLICLNRRMAVKNREITAVLVKVAHFGSEHLNVLLPCIKFAHKCLMSLKG
jgi:hypothetical protein